MLIKKLLFNEMTWALKGIVFAISICLKLHKTISIPFYTGQDTNFSRLLKRTSASELKTKEGRRKDRKPIDDVKEAGGPEEGQGKQKPWKQHGERFGKSATWYLGWQWTQEEQKEAHNWLRPRSVFNAQFERQDSFDRGGDVTLVSVSLFKWHEMSAQPALITVANQGGH